MDWLDLLVVQGTLKNLLQHHSSKSSILWHSAFFIVQLSHSYVTTGKTIALSRWTFVGKVMSLLFKKLSSLVKAFLPRTLRRRFLVHPPSQARSPVSNFLSCPCPHGRTCPGGEGGWLGYLANQFCATKCRASSSPEQTSQSLKGKIAPSHLCGWGES